MKFCDKVKKERRAKGLTQQQFADMLGVSLRTITNYEKGESYPKQREIYGKMAEILGIDINRKRRILHKRKRKVRRYRRTAGESAYAGGNRTFCRRRA